MPDDRLYTDADVEQVAEALESTLAKTIPAVARAVLETLTAAGSPLLARHRAQVAEQIAQTIEAMGHDDRGSVMFARRWCARIAREVGGTTGEETT